MHTVAPPINPTMFSSFDKLLKSRIIWLGTDVNDEMANEIASKLLLLSAEDSEADIYMFINSPGGSITAGMVIYDVMKMIPNDVVTIAVGMAASMGQFLLTAGTKGKRFITPYARVLLHQPLGGINGESTNIQIQAQLIKDMKYTLAKITADNTGKTTEQVIQDGDRDNWFNAEEALDYGFVDHIYTGSVHGATLLAQISKVIKNDSKTVTEKKEK